MTEKKVVQLELIKGSDGHWLSFKDSTGKEATINIENKFPRQSGIINNCIRQWAVDQFKKTEGE